jgi:general stress protein 26
MQSIPRPEQNAIWFFSGADGQADEDLQQDPRACLIFADVKEHAFVSISGRITRVTERDTVKDLWNEAAQTYFPAGPDDEHVVLLRFEPETGEYWDARSSSMAALALRFLAAKVTGSRPSVGNSGSADLHQFPETAAAKPPGGAEPAG